MSRHSALTANHIVENWSYTDTAEREADTGVAVADLGKVAHQVDNGSYWRLTAITPTWEFLMGGGLHKVNDIGDHGGGAQLIDLALGNSVNITVSTSAVTYTLDNILPAGTEHQFRIYLTNGGSQTINWFSGVVWPGGSEPSWTAAGLDVVTFITNDGGTVWYGIRGGAAMS
jgi:hypothetical protein